MVGTNAPNKICVGKKAEDVKVVTDRTVCETSGVCFRVAVEKEKEIC